MVPHRYRVVGVHHDLPDTATLRLQPEGAGIGPCRPGQFNMLWTFGGGEVPISLSGLGPDGSLEHTVRSVGAATGALCALREGDILGVRGPFGSSWDLQAARGRDVVVVAGGIGLAPLRPVVPALLAGRADYGQRDGVIDVGLTVDHPDAGWHGEVGVVTALFDSARIAPERTVAFLCGPEVMLTFAGAALVDRGVPTEAVQVSLERNMRCAIGHCGHCQIGSTFLCLDGPVLTFDRARPLMAVTGR
jgi:NAD(P)H-flavin reductase